MYIYIRSHFGPRPDHWKSLELIKTNKKKICLIHSKEINHKKRSNLNKRLLDVLNMGDMMSRYHLSCFVCRLSAVGFAIILTLPFSDIAKLAG